MNDQKKDSERRSFKRIEVPGAIVRCKVDKGLKLLKNFSNQAEIINLSKSGLSFHLNDPVNYGTPVEMKVKFPDGENLSLKGRIRWQKSVNGSGQQTIGVMLNPFGPKKQYNPMKALEYFRSIKELAISHPFKAEET